MSYGPDGHGGYLAGGTRMNAGSTNTDEQTNAHYNNLGVNQTYTATYVQKDWTQDPADAKDSFDDLVRYKERWQLINEDDKWTPSGSKGSCGAPGFRVDGYDPNAYSSSDGVIFCDLNGDGIPDLVITAPLDPGGNKVYVIWGTASGFPNPLPLNNLNGSNGVELDQGGGKDTYTACGDVNGDGIQDLAISGDGITVYILFGHTQASLAWTTPQSLSNVTGNGGAMPGVAISHNGGSGNDFGRDGIDLGDINGDHIADIIANDNANNKLYVVFGHTQASSAWNSTLDYTTVMDGTHGFYINGTAAQWTSGNTIVADINGDTYGDIIMGSSGGTYPGDPHAGEMFVILGHSGSWAAQNNTAVTALNGTTGFTIYNTADNPDDWPGGLTAGDFNGDGAQDILFTGGYDNPLAHGCTDRANSSSGMAYILWGTKTAWGAGSFSAAYDLNAMIGTSKVTYFCLDATTDGGNGTIL